ncbi:tubulin-specific chaperone C [Chironomus tepperi]|uniref:tubulin-specific chaperone C n=1 Tax=Chironomus tepperi TaxID=113505 RepID=UPI00391EF7D6
MEGEDMKTETPKSGVLEMMARRDRERKLVNEKNQKARQNKSQEEGLQYFESVFDGKVCEIENRINAMIPSSDLGKLQEEFNSIARDLQDLQKYFTNSTFFLSDHKIKTCQIVINQLLTKSDETKSKLLPKKKFGFKNKSSKPSAKLESDIQDGQIKPDVKESTHKEFLWTESQKTNQLLKYTGDQVNNQDMTFKEMENCVIFINGHAGSLQMSKMKNCLVLCGAVSRSVFADNCENCTFAFACQQLRLHSSTFCNIYILVTSRAIIEDCKDINIAPNTYSYSEYESDLQKSGLDGSINNWENVGDFNWLSTDKPSPNWNRMKDDEKVCDWSQFINDFINAHNITSE